MQGDHGIFGKKTNFERAIRAPMIIRVPGVQTPPQVRTELVEFVDLFSTLTDLAGLPRPSLCPRDSRNVPVCTEGSSLVPLLAATLPVEWKDAAFSWYPTCSASAAAHASRPAVRLTQLPPSAAVHDIPPYNGCLNPGDPKVMGYSIRTSDNATVGAYRYTEWVPFNKTTGKPDWTTVLARELYDHSEGADGGENHNVAALPRYQAAVAALSAKLHAGWRAALPPPSRSVAGGGGQ